MTTETPRSLLLVDDDDVLRSRLVRAFTRRGFEVRSAADIPEAEALALDDAPEWAVVDLRMPSGSGLPLVQRLLEIEPATRVVVLTGYGSIATAVEAIRLGAAYYLPKPADVDDILTAFTRGSAHPLDVVTEEEEEHEAPSLARAEWEHINRVLSDCGGNISKTARVLGIHRRSLQRKLQKYPPRR